MSARGRGGGVRDEIVFLGTADGLPSAGRLHAAVLVRLSGATVLVDCGEPCAHTLKQRGEDFDAVDAVFVSHCHLDHVGGLPMLLHDMRFEGRRRRLDVFLPRRAIRPLRAWLRHCLIDEERFGYPIGWRAISTRSPARLGRLSVAACRTSHLDAARLRWGGRGGGLAFDAYAFLLEGEEKRVAYSGDVGGPADLEPLLAHPLDVLIVEGAHVGAPQLKAALAGRDVGRVLLTHVARRGRGPHGAPPGGGWRGRLPAGWRMVADGDVVGF